jgi:hypothetical protein
VIRNITVVISVAVTGAGIWLLSRIHSVINACNSLASPTSGTGLRLGCQSSLSLYFLSRHSLAGDIRDQKTPSQ